ncbi:MAG: hypothetical protein HFJ49_01235 [Clostridia bacterium]|nr:hypothetical protein [Clostridia bacterium]
MGLFKKIVDLCTEPVDPNQKGIFERIYEACTEPVEDENETEENNEQEEKEDVSFADSKRAEQIAESINGKIQAKKRELRIIGQSLSSMDLNKIQKSAKGKLINGIIEDYYEICEKLEKVINQQEIVAQKDETEPMSIENTMHVLNLQTMYGEFEGVYIEKIQLVNNLFWLSELKKQNNNMKLDFEGKTGKEVNNKRIKSYRKYIQTISDQKEEFTYQLGDELIEELIISEYRLKMLTLMRDISEGKEELVNPFERENSAKKVKYEELLLEDIEEANKQYGIIEREKTKYINSGLFERKDFNKLNKLAQEIGDNIDLAMVDDLSISEVFTDEEFATIKKFIKLRIKMNYIISKREKVKPNRRKSRDILANDIGETMWSSEVYNRILRDMGEEDDEFDY